MAASTDDLRRVSEFLARRGVTAWMPTLVPAPAEQYERATSAIEDALNSDDYKRALTVAEEALQRIPNEPGLLKLKAMAEKQRIYVEPGEHVNVNFKTLSTVQTAQR